MRKIYKYILDATLQIVMPTEAVIFTVVFQKRDLCIWAVVDTDQQGETTRVFNVYGAGHVIDELSNVWNQVFLGTAFSPDGLVFHISEVRGVLDEILPTTI